MGDVLGVYEEAIGAALLERERLAVPDTGEARGGHPRHQLPAAVAHLQGDTGRGTQVVGHPEAKR